MESVKKDAEMVKRDCFAYRIKGSAEMCTALKELYCKKEKCGFYKRLIPAREGD